MTLPDASFLAYTYDAAHQTVGAVTKSVAYGYIDGNLTSLTTMSRLVATP